MPTKSFDALIRVSVIIRGLLQLYIAVCGLELLNSGSSIEVTCSSTPVPWI